MLMIPELEMTIGTVGESEDVVGVDSMVRTRERLEISLPKTTCFPSK